MKKDPPGKTRKFLLLALLAWAGLCLLSGILQLTTFALGDLHLRSGDAGLLGILTQALWLPIIALPLIMILAVVLKLAEKLIDRL